MSTIETSRAQTVARLRDERARRIARTVAAVGAAGQVTGADVEREAQREALRPMWGGWDVATLQRLRSDARTVSKSSAAPPADDLVSAAILRAAEHQPDRLRDLTAPDVATRERGFAYLRGAMRSEASHAVRAALLEVSEADQLRRDRMVAAAIEADGPVSKADPDVARFRVTSSDRFAAALEGGQDAADRVRYGRGMAKMREASPAGARRDPMVKGAVRLLREQSLESLLQNGSGATVHVLEHGGSEASKRYQVDPGAQRLERQAESAALSAALGALPGGKAGTMGWKVAMEVRTLEGLTRQGWMRRAAALQRMAKRHAQRADVLGAAALALVDGQGVADAAGRKRAKLAAAEAVKLAESCEAGALALVGALGATDGAPTFRSLLEAATGVSREGRPLLDVGAVLVCLDLPTGDAPATALRRQLRAATGALGLGKAETGRTRAEALAEAEGTLLVGSPAAKWEAHRAACLADGTWTLDQLG